MLLLSTSVLPACSSGGAAQPPKQIAPVVAATEPTKIASLVVEQPKEASAPIPNAPQPTITPPINNVNPKGAKIYFWYSMPDEQIAPILNEFNTGNEWGITVEAINLGSNSELSNNIKKGIIENDAPAVALGFTDQAVRWIGTGK